MKCLRCPYLHITSAATRGRRRRCGEVGLLGFGYGSIPSPAQSIVFFPNPSSVPFVSVQSIRVSDDQLPLIMLCFPQQEEEQRAARLGESDVEEVVGGRRRRRRETEVEAERGRVICRTPDGSVSTWITDETNDRLSLSGFWALFFLIVIPSITRWSWKWRNWRWIEGCVQKLKNEQSLRCSCDFFRNVVSQLVCSCWYLHLWRVDIVLVNLSSDDLLVYPLYQLPCISFHYKRINFISNVN